MGEWKPVLEQLDSARRFDPVSPALIEQRVELLAWRVNDGGVITNRFAEVRDNLVEALVARPTSGNVWANLAWVKFQMGEMDARFYQALDQAMRLAPWEPEVQLAVVDLGFATWNEMPVHLRAPVLQTAENGSRRYAQGIMTISARRGRLTEVCGFEKLSSMAECRQARKV